MHLLSDRCDRALPGRIDDLDADRPRRPGAGWKGLAQR